MNTLLRWVKNFYHSIIFSLELIGKNLVLFLRLVLLVGVSLVAGIILPNLFSYFNEGVRTISWYLGNVVLIGGLAVCVTFIWYLILDILRSHIKTGVKKAQAEHRVRANEDSYRSFFEGKRPILSRLFPRAETKLLPHDPQPKETEQTGNE